MTSDDFLVITARHALEDKRGMRLVITSGIVAVFLFVIYSISRFHHSQYVDVLKWISLGSALFSGFLVGLDLQRQRKNENEMLNALSEVLK